MQKEYKTTGAVREFLMRNGSIGGSRSSPAKTAANKIKAKLPRKPRKSDLEHSMSVLDTTNPLPNGLDQG